MVEPRRHIVIARRQFDGRFLADQPRIRLAGQRGRPPVRVPRAGNVVLCQQGGGQPVPLGHFADIAAIADRIAVEARRRQRFHHRNPGLLPRQQEFDRIGRHPRRLAGRAVLGVGHPLGGHRVGTQESQRIVVVDAVGLLQPLEETAHRPGIETGLAQCLDADAVGLALEVAAERQLVLDRQPRAGSGSGNRRIGTTTGTGGQHGGQHAAERHQVAQSALLHLPRDMVLGHVRHFVRHDRGQFAFVLCRDDQPGMDADIAAGHGEGVDLVVVDGEQPVMLGRVGAGIGQPHRHPPQVVIQLGIAKQGIVLAQPAEAVAAGARFVAAGKTGLRRIPQIGQQDLGRDSRADQQASQQEGGRCSHAVNHSRQTGHQSCREDDFRHGSRVQSGYTRGHSRFRSACA